MRNNFLNHALRLDATPEAGLGGRSTMVWQTSITNEAGKLCAVVTQTQLVLDAAA